MRFFAPRIDPLQEAVKKFCNAPLLEGIEQTRSIKRMLADFTQSHQMTNLGCMPACAQNTTDEIYEAMAQFANILSDIYSGSREMLAMSNRPALQATLKNGRNVFDAAIRFNEENLRQDEAVLNRVRAMGREEYSQYQQEKYAAFSPEKKAAHNACFIEFLKTREREYRQQGLGEAEIKDLLSTEKAHLFLDFDHQLVSLNKWINQRKNALTLLTKIRDDYQRIVAEPLMREERGR